MSEYIVTCDEETASWIGNDVDSMRKIVRCRDCRCFDEETSLCNRLCKFPEWHACTEPDGFCKWAERRDK